MTEMNKSLKESPNIVLAGDLIAILKQNGADLVGLAPIERFADSVVPKILPLTRTIIGVAFRVLRGSHRHIEEGTTYYQYTTNSVETLEETVMPMALLRASAILEDQGFTALPQRWNPLIRADEIDCGTNPEVRYKEIYRTAREFQMDFAQSAVLCGLGEIGLSGTLLTDEFGPLQRYCFILTDAELPATPLPQPHLCDQCGACVQACPGGAISADGQLDSWQCATYYAGASRKTNPFMPPDAFAGQPDRLAIIAGEVDLTPERAREVLDQLVFYPGVKHGYVSSICGKACDRACYVHLEEKGVLSRKFLSKFRKREVWELD